MYLGNYMVPIANRRQVLAETRQLVGPNVVLHGALTTYNNILATGQQMVDASRELLLGGADRLWIYREDYLSSNNLWSGAGLANDKFIRMKGLTGTSVQGFDAAVAGAGVEPNEVNPAWTAFGSALMANNGVFLLQDNTVNPAAQSGEYYSPAQAGLMTNATGNYAVEFEVRPLADISGTEGQSTYANLHVTWSDDVFRYSVCVDRDSDDAGAGTTGGLRVGGNAMVEAVSGVDWTTPHTVGVVWDRVDGEFYFSIDGVLKNSLPDTTVDVGASDSGLRNRVAFGDSTTGGTDAAGEWYWIDLLHNAVSP
jgi:hypothetical protein